MYRTALTVSMATLLALAAPAAMAENETNLNVFYGEKSLDEGEWSPIDDQPEAGVMFDTGPADSPWRFALDVFHSSDDATISGTDFDLSTSEVAIGTRYYRSIKRVDLYVGGGLAAIQADYEVSNGTGSIDDDAVVGAFWVGAGLQFHPIENMNLGFALRFSSSPQDAELFDSDASVGGLHAGVTAGVQF